MSDPADAHDGKDSHQHSPDSKPAVAADLSTVLHEARQRFVSTFAAQCESLAPLAGQAGVKPLPLTAAVKLLHRMAGMGGTVGFPRVSAKAAEIEEAVDTGTMHRTDLAGAMDALRAAFQLDLAGSGPVAPSLEAAAASLTVLLVEDEPVQRAIMSAQLRALGHAPVTVATGEEALGAARQARPDVILLDVELPGISGYAVCKLLKADPTLAGIPLAFLSAHSTVDDRLQGLSLGADDFLTKPLDPRELALRLQRLGQRRPVAVASREGGGVLADQVVNREASDAVRLRPAPARDAVIGGASEPLVLVADDDPDVLRIIDAQLAAAGYRRILASDGTQALAEMHAQHPDVMVLDLMMPWTSGFDVLAGVRDMGESRPRVVVLSARGREENVMRAFSLGADDFMLKPFNPQELLARVSRLLQSSDRLSRAS